MEPVLKFVKHAVYTPDPTPAKPRITEDERARAAADPPSAVPFHCKPWLDGQKLGYTLFYGYLSPITIVGLGDNKIAVEGEEQVMKERKGRSIADTFAAGHFGLSIAYTLITKQGFNTLILPANDPPAGFDIISGVIETDWYPKGLFLVSRMPEKGERIAIDYGDELARAVVIPRPKPLPPAVPLTDEELDEFDVRAQQYKQEEKTTHTRWIDVYGKPFTHLYRVWSSQRRSG